MFRRLQNLPLFSPATSMELRTWQWLALIGGGLAWAVPVDSLGFSVCFFYNLTGLPCPGCGMTRAVHFALHLQPVHAFYHHPVGLLAAVMVVFFSISAIWRPAGRLFERYKRHTAAAVMAIAITMLSFGLARGFAVASGNGPAARALPEGFRVVLKDRRLLTHTGDFWRGLFAD